MTIDTVMGEVKVDTAADNGKTPVYNSTSKSFIMSNVLQDGRIEANETWTYASATTFTISGDLTGKYQRGDRIKLTQTTVKYFVILKVAHSAGTTTVTITGGTSYTFANAAVSLNYFSKQLSPQGYPDWFDFTPVWTGFSADPTADFCRFSIQGSTCKQRVSCTVNGTSNSTSFAIGTPYSIIASGKHQGSCYFPVDNTSTLNQAYVNINDGGTTVSFAKEQDTATSRTASGGKRCNMSIEYQFTL